MLVGGVPWSDRAEDGPHHDLQAMQPADAAVPTLDWAPSPATTPKPVRPGLRRRPGWLRRFFNEEDLDETGRLAVVARQRLDRLVRQSPPVTVSVLMHVLVLLVLAICFVRRPRDERTTIDLEFSATEIVELPEQGVTIVPEKVEEPVPEPEVVKSEKPPVEDVSSAPVPMETEELGPGAAADVPMTAAAIGTLLEGREEGRREGLVAEFGGSTETEAAVARALAWLVRQQAKDGLWSLQGPYADAARQENRLAATAMALLALQGAGNTPDKGRHRVAVGRAWRALLARQLPDGEFDLGPIPSQQELYAHGQITIALCELHGMTGAKVHGERARRALDYAIKAQGPAGGWRYEPGRGGDMSVTGWFVMALKSGQMSGLDVPAETFANASAFLDFVAVDGGSRYGYLRDSPEAEPRQATAAVSAEGLLCRQYLGWSRDDPRLVRGLEMLIEENPIDFESAARPLGLGADAGRDAVRRDKNAYAWYYITQVAHHFGGDPWNRWNAQLKTAVPAAQTTKGRDAGSWDPVADQWGHVGGRLYMTCFCTFMLEVYYRHLPLYRQQAAGEGAVQRAGPKP